MQCRIIQAVLLTVFFWSTEIEWGLSSLQADENEAARNRYALVIHGGAGGDPSRWSETRQAAVRRCLEEALDEGLRLLAEGGSSLDVVEAVIRKLEDEPFLNAGRGAVLNEHGEHELDASIMDGRTRDGGAVGAVRSVKNPISLARLVMSETPHVLLVAEGAETFARKMQVETRDTDYFRTPDAVRRWQQAQERSPANQAPQIPVETPDNDGARRHLDAGDQPLSGYGTVGCVALDKDGNLAAGTSTGGLLNKRAGRIGDSPILGAGTYADNETCAVSCTGIGEKFIRHAVAFDIAARMRHADRTLAESVHEVLHKTLQPGDGGVIAIDRQGNIVMDFTTAAMLRAAGDSSGRKEVHWGTPNPLPQTLRE